MVINDKLKQTQFLHYLFSTVQLIVIVATGIGSDTQFSPSVQCHDTRNDEPCEERSSFQSARLSCVIAVVWRFYHPTKTAFPLMHSTVAQCLESHSHPGCRAPISFFQQCPSDIWDIGRANWISASQTCTKYSGQDSGVTVTSRMLRKTLHPDCLQVWSLFRN